MNCKFILGNIQQQCSALTRMASKKKDLSDVTNEEALAHLEELFCKTCATGELFLYLYVIGNHNLMLCEERIQSIFFLL